MRTELPQYRRKSLWAGSGHVAIAVVLALVACSPGPIQVSSPSPPSPETTAPSIARSTPPPTAAPAAVEHAPRLVLSVPYAPSVDALGATTARVGGLSPVGATTFAVDEQDRIFIWDRARLRVAVFEAGTFSRAISLPFVEQDARSLLVHGDRLYLRFGSGFSGSLEYEIDAPSGGLLRAVRLGTSIYPRSRAIDVRAGLPPSGEVTDAFGNSYVLDVSTAVQRYRRVHPSGATLAYAVEPLATKAIDMYARADGALYELASDWGGVGSAYVYALMPPIGPAAALASSAPPATPVAFGRPVPDQLVATLPRAGSVDLIAAARLAFWWLASTGVENANVGPIAPGGARFEARWNDGSRLSIGFDGPVIGDGTKNYLTPTRVWGQLAGHALASPSRIFQLTASGSATIRITDLVGTERALTGTELSALRVALSTAFSVSEGELPGDLELPFPVYEIALGDTVVQLRRDRYAAVSRFGALAHDGSLYDLVRRALPVPPLSLDDPRSLFLAERVTIEQDGLPSMTGDITRWKAGLVRALTGTEPVANAYPDAAPLTLTFAFAGGRSERVRVTRMPTPTGESSTRARGSSASSATAGSPKAALAPRPPTDGKLGADC